HAVARLTVRAFSVASLPFCVQDHQIAPTVIRESNHQRLVGNRIVDTSDDLRQRSLALSKSFSFMAAVPPILASVGLIFHVDPFKQIHPLLPAMQPNTAVGLVLSAVAILFTGENRPASQRWVAFILAVVILFLGLLTLGEYVFAWDLGIDRVFMGSTSG